MTMRAVMVVRVRGADPRVSCISWPAMTRRPSPTPLTWRAVAWTGGATFVGALAAGAWWFVVELGRPVPGTPAAGPIAWNTALFVLFAAHHSVMARSGAKRWLARHLPAPLERACYVWVASLLFLALCAAWQPVPGFAWRWPHPAGTWTARGIQVAGLLLTLQAARMLDGLDLAGIRQATGRPTVPPRASIDGAVPGMDAITARGPYGLVRHPIYLGWVLMVFAVPSMTAGRLLFALVSTAYLAIAIPWEERSLVEEFGESYRAYQRTVRWRLVPGVY
jgi:protein-S-isoprenylcysteine O-methyltransferase Ste14